MPSPNRFVVPNEDLTARLRERPIILAAGALVCGALLGGLAVYQPTGAPHGIPARTAAGSVPPAAAPGAKRETAVPANEAEPTVPAKWSAAPINCDEQTWPYLSHECAERKRRSVRVITTDKLSAPLVSAIEGPPPEGNVPPVAKPAPAAVASAPPPEAPNPAATTSPPLGSPPQIAAAEPSASTTPSPAVSTTADISRDASKKSKRKKTKSRDRSIEVNDDHDRAHPSDRTGVRIVERWTEREFDVPSDDRSGRRKRVVIIDRDNWRSEKDGERWERNSERSERRSDFFFGRGGLPVRF